MGGVQGSGSLEWWLQGGESAVQPVLDEMGDGLRFAFYGRNSTLQHQDPVTSKGWQLEAAQGLVADRGVIVAEFFDVGCSRRESWWDRPQAAALLAAVMRPDRGFDAIVVGEYERAFAAGQFEEVAAVFERYGVQVWLPEANGPVQVGSVMHRALVTVLGVQSQREVVRARHRVRAAMCRQVVEQGSVSGWAAAVWVSAGGWRAASESGACAVGAAAARAGAGSGDGAACAVDVRAAAGGV